MSPIVDLFKNAEFDGHVEIFLFWTGNTLFWQIGRNRLTCLIKLKLILKLINSNM